MKNILLLAVLAAALPGWAEVRCCMLLPDTASLERRVRDGKSTRRFKVAATKVATQETQTDVVNVVTMLLKK